MSSNREKMIEKLGSEEAYLEWMRANASKGGKSIPVEKRAFHRDRELAKRAGKLGGSKK